MRLDGNEARAARAAARAEPIEYVVGDLKLTFASEMPVDVLDGMDDALLVSNFELVRWLIAHTLADAGCQTQCLDEDDRGRSCPAVAALRKEMRGKGLAEGDLDEMWAKVRKAQGVSAGESSSSAESSETAGDSSSATASDSGSIPTPSGNPEPAASDA